MASVGGILDRYAEELASRLKGCKSAYCLLMKLDTIISEIENTARGDSIPVTDFATRLLKHPKVVKALSEIEYSVGEAEKLLSYPQFRRLRRYSEAILSSLREARRKRIEASEQATSEARVEEQAAKSTTEVEEAEDRAEEPEPSNRLERLLESTRSSIVSRAARDVTLRSLAVGYHTLATGLLLLVSQPLAVVLVFRAPQSLVQPVTLASIVIMAAGLIALAEALNTIGSIARSKMLRACSQGALAVLASYILALAVDYNVAPPPPVPVHLILLSVGYTLLAVGVARALNWSRLPLSLAVMSSLALLEVVGADVKPLVALAAVTLIAVLVYDVESRLRQPQRILGTH